MSESEIANNFCGETIESICAKLQPLTNNVIYVQDGIADTVSMEEWLNLSEGFTEGEYQEDNMWIIRKNTEEIWIFREDLAK